MTKALLVDDEQTVASLSVLLKQEGYDVRVTTSGIQALEIARAEQPDLILLALRTAEIDGIELCRRIRMWSAVPIILLSGKAGETEEVSGLEAGADDYITKPFGPRELLARIRASLRRAQVKDDQIPGHTLQAGDIVMDVERRRVMVRGREVELSPKAFGLLQVLMSHPNRVLGRDILLSRVWGEEFFGSTRTLDVHIRWLRKKIEENPQQPQYIQTVHGVGYRLKA